MFPPIHHRLYGVHCLQRLHRLEGLRRLDRLDHLLAGVRGTALRGVAAGHRRVSRGPSLVTLLVAGLAVVAFVKLMTAASSSSRSRTRTIALAVLLIAVGAVVMSFRRSAKRYRL